MFVILKENCEFMGACRTYEKAVEFAKMFAELEKRAYGFPSRYDVIDENCSSRIFVINAEDILEDK